MRGRVQSVDLCACGWPGWSVGFWCDTVEFVRGWHSKHILEYPSSASPGVQRQIPLSPWVVGACSTRDRRVYQNIPQTRSPVTVANRNARCVPQANNTAIIYIYVYTCVPCRSLLSVRGNWAGHPLCVYHHHRPDQQCNLIQTHEPRQHICLAFFPVLATSRRIAIALWGPPLGPKVSQVN